MEELEGEGREEGGGEWVGAPFNVLPSGATDLVAPLDLHRHKVGTLAVWAVIFGTARRELGGDAAHPCPSSLYQV